VFSISAAGAWVGTRAAGGGVSNRAWGELKGLYLTTLTPRRDPDAPGERGTTSSGHAGR
jgi:hypothetical protein